jgi:hypothetical protein
MKVKFALIAGMMALAACASIKNPIQSTQVYELENAYGVAQSAAVSYVALPRCPTAAPLCSKANSVVAIGEADKKARVALSALEDFSRNPQNYPNLSYGSLLAAARSAINVLSSLTKSA